MGRASRPFIFVLAGVNGAGKSTVGGNLLTEHGLSWFNPDSLARELVATQRFPIEEANAVAWQVGRDQLEQAIAAGGNFAFETTLGGNTIRALLEGASMTHDLVMWFCGLASPELHLQRVKARVASGGHDIPESRIRERWDSSRRNLIRLLPYLTHLQVFDNSAHAAPGRLIRNPVLLMEMVNGRLISPKRSDLVQLGAVPVWAMAIVEAGIRLEELS